MTHSLPFGAGSSRAYSVLSHALKRPPTGGSITKPSPQESALAHLYFLFGVAFFFKLNSEVITSTEILGLFTIKSGVPPLERLEGLISGVCILTGQQELDLLEMGMDGPQSIQPRYTQPTSIHLDCLP